MAKKNQTQSALDSQFARVLALVLAGLIAILFYLNWFHDLVNLFASQPAEPQVVEEVIPVEEINPELAACLKQRVGDVDKMQQDGILSDAQYADFKERAIQLCRQLNPT